MSITSADITDPTFLKLPSTESKDSYIALGALMFSSLCVKHSIDETLISDPTPWVPLRIQVVCVLIVLCKDRIGSDWQSVKEGVNIDVYQSKLNSLTDELNELLTSFTPTMCGYEEDGDLTGVGSVVFSYSRA